MAGSVFRTVRFTRRYEGGDWIVVDGEPLGTIAPNGLAWEIKCSAAERELHVVYGPLSQARGYVRELYAQQDVERHNAKRVTS